MAVLRSFLQLTAVGYVIKAIFDSDSLWLVALLLAVPGCARDAHPSRLPPVRPAVRRIRGRMRRLPSRLHLLGAQRCDSRHSRQRRVRRGDGAIAGNADSRRKSQTDHD